MLSIVIPLYNEADLVDELMSRTIAVAQQIEPNYEIIIIDDGSTDGTLASLLKLREANPNIKILQLSRNFGHQAAYSAGLQHAKGEYIAVLDGDLQDPPELISEMYDKMKAQNLDVVYGKRTNGPQLSRRPFLSGVFHKIFKRMSGLQDIDNVGNFSLLSKKALDAILQFKENNRYLPGLRAFIGYKQECVEYERSERYAGQSKMKISQLISLSADAIFSFSKLPINFSLSLIYSKLYI